MYITDISQGDETPKEKVWEYQMLRSNMAAGKANLVRFNFDDIQVSSIITFKC